MSKESITSNQQEQQEGGEVQNENRQEINRSASSVYGSIINSVGPDLSIPGEKTNGYNQNQQQALYGHNQSILPTQYNNIQDTSWSQSHKQLGENAHWPYWGNHQASQCCCVCSYYRNYQYRY